MASSLSNSHNKLPKWQSFIRIQIFPKMQISPNLFPLPQAMLQSDLINQPQPTEPNKSKRENKNMHLGAYGHFRNYYHDAHFGHQ